MTTVYYMLYVTYTVSVIMYSMGSTSGSVHNTVTVHVFFKTYCRQGREKLNIVTVQ